MAFLKISTTDTFLLCILHDSRGTKITGFITRTLPTAAGSEFIRERSSVKKGLEK